MLFDMSSGNLLAKTLDGMSQELDNFLVFALEILAKILSCRDTAAVGTDLCSTDIRADLLERWAQVAQDPGVGVCGWLKFGANAGLCADPVGLQGVFPVDSHEEPGDEALCAQDGVAKRSVADDQEAMKHIWEYVNEGWLEHTTRAQFQEEYGDDHTISEFCCITKVKKRQDEKADHPRPEEKWRVQTNPQNAPCRAAQTVRSGAALARIARHQGSPSIRGSLCPGLLRRVLADSARPRRTPSCCWFRWQKLLEIPMISSGLPQWPPLLGRTFLFTHEVHTRSLHRHVPRQDHTRSPCSTLS